MGLAARLKAKRLRNALTEAFLDGDVEAQTSLARQAVALHDPAATRMLVDLLRCEDVELRELAREGLLELVDSETVRMEVLNGALARLMTRSARFREEAAAAAAAGAREFEDTPAHSADAPLDPAAIVGAYAVTFTVRLIAQVAGLPDTEAGLLEEATEEARQAALGAAPSSLSADDVHAIASDPSEALAFVDAIVSAANLAFQARLYRERA